MVYSKLYNKLSYARILIGSHLWSIGGQTYFVIINTFFNSLLYKTNRFRVVVLLFSNRSQRTSKCGKNKVAHEAQPSVSLFCSYHILTSSVTYYWTDARQLGIYLLSRMLFRHLYIVIIGKKFTWDHIWYVSCKNLIHSFHLERLANISIVSLT